MLWLVICLAHCGRCEMNIEDLQVSSDVPVLRFVAADASMSFDCLV